MLNNKKGITLIALVVTVVTKDVPPYTIVGGTPAKEIRKRFDENTIVQLQKLQWWDWSIEKISECIPYITGGKIEELIKR